MFLLLSTASFWGSSAALDLAIACFILGVILCIIEMFLPGFGIFGACGVALLFAGILLKTVGSEGGLGEALLLILGALAVLGVTAYLSARSLARGAISRSPIVLNDATSADEGFSSSADLDAYLGREGIADTVLRPAGAARIDGRRLDVIAEGAFIAPGTPIKVIQVSGCRIVVAPTRA